MFLAEISKITPTRNFNMTYIVFDILFLVFLVVLLIIKKKYLTLFWSLFGGLLYLCVDFGLFYLASGTRSISINGETLDVWGHFFVLLWLSLSYGIPNFIFIWMALSKDEYFWLFTILIVGWWLVLPTLSQFGNMEGLKDTFFADQIMTKRTTGNFHWIMGMFLILGYGFLITYYVIKDKDNLKKHIKTILWLNLIGIATQFMWECPLLLNGIRPLDDSSFITLIVNSIVETNSGMVYFYIFNLLITKKLGIQEDFKIGQKRTLKEVI